MSQTYSKDALREMAKEAAQKYVSQDRPMNETIEKIAKERKLNDHQVKRVCEYANHKVNAKLAEDSAYTTFDLADPDKILEAKEASFAGAYLGGLKEDEPSDSDTEKTASFSEEISQNAEMIEKVGRHYGTEINLRKIAQSSNPVYRFVKAASQLLSRISEEANRAKHAAMKEEEKIFEEVKQALLDGIKIERIAKDLKSENKEYLLEKIWPRLEAEGLVEKSHYEEGGPYSRHRKLKQANIRKNAEAMQEAFEYELPDENLLFKSANRFEESVRDIETGVRSYNLICSATKKIAGMNISSSRELEKSARAVETFQERAEKTSGMLWEGAKTVGKNLGKGVWKGTKGALDKGYKASRAVGRKIKADEDATFGTLDRLGIAGAGTAAAMTGAQNMRDSFGKQITPGV